ncbi:hypothetical protein ACWDY4_32250 [Streptomyces olivaceoviridis]
MACTPQPGGPPAAAAPGQPHIRRAVALPLHEDDLDGTAVSEALIRVGAPAPVGEAVTAPDEENVRPLVTAIPDAAVRAQAEVAARTFRPDDGRTPRPESTPGAETAGRPPSQPGKPGHWPLVAAAAVAGAVLVSVPLLSGGDKKTADASDTLDKVAVAGAGRGAAGEATSAPVPDGSAGADVTFPAPATPTTTARAGAPTALPGDGRHGSAHGTAPGHGDTAAGHAGARTPGHPTVRPSASASPLHGSYTPPHGDTPRPAHEQRSASPASAPAESFRGAGRTGHASTAGTTRHAATHSETAVSAQKPRTATRTTATTSRAASTQTSHPQTSAARQATPAQTSSERRAATGTQTQTTARTTAAAAPSHAQAQATAQRHWSTKVVNATYVLHSGESVASDRMRITMRTNGDLVVSDEHGTVRWSSHTHGSGNYAVFQDDGNLAVYSANHTSLWTSGTAGNAGAELVIQSDGNVVILSRSGTAVWAAGTAH